MTDRGEKIVSLAEAILDTHIQASGSHRRLPAPCISLRVFYLTAALSTIGTCLATQHFCELHRPINRYEQVEIEALFYYADHAKGLATAPLRQKIKDTFHLKSLNNMTRHDYVRVRAYLWDRLSA